MRDTTRSPGLFEPQRTRLEEHSVTTKAKLDELISELSSAGVLDTDAVNRIKATEDSLR